MGSGGNYLEDGGFLYYEWKEEQKRIGEYKVLRNPNDVRNSLPLHSNTSDAYFKKNEDGEIDQMRIYVNRTANMDIDIMPEKAHSEFPKGVAHVHDWVQNKKGEWRRSKNARYLTNEEIAKWGDVIRLANPNVRFRP